MGLGGGIGAAVGLGAGLLLAPATGGASLLAAGALGAGLGGAAGNAIQAASSQQSYATPDPNKQMAGLIGQKETQANNTTAGQYAQQMTQGNAAATARAGSTGLSTESSQMGGSGAMSQAIANKAANNFSKSMNNINTDSQLQGMQTQMGRQNEATQDAVNLANYQRGVGNSVNYLNMQSQAARYQTLGSLFGGAGKIGGLAAGGQLNWSNPMGGASNITPGGVDSAGGGMGAYTDPGVGMVG